MMRVCVFRIDIDYACPSEAAKVGECTCAVLQLEYNQPPYTLGRSLEISTLLQCHIDSDVWLRRLLCVRHLGGLQAVGCHDLLVATVLRSL